MKRKEKPISDFDTPWKEILEQYFKQFMAFFFPQAHEKIDWSKNYEFLDKELQKIVRDAELGRRLVDKLIKIWTKDNLEKWILIHIEVQGKKELDFEERMYVYNYRIFDKYKRKTASCVILTDEKNEWRPKMFGYNLFGSEIKFSFPVVKLIDYRSKMNELQKDPNPFAIVVMAHL